MVDIPLKEGLFEQRPHEGGEPRLLGARCGICGYSCFPPRPVCPQCLKNDSMDRTEFGPRGVLESFAVMQIGAEGIPAPYAIGYVRLLDGPTIYTMLESGSMSEEAFSVGGEMRLEIGKVRTDEQGRNLIGWKFRPAAMEKGDRS